MLIPPSVMLILYGATAGVSVPKLYAGALFPGLLLAGLYMTYVVVRCMITPSLAPKLPPEERAKLGIDLGKDKLFVLGYIAIAVVAVPAVYYGVLALEGLINAIKTATAPAGARVRLVDYEVPPFVIQAVIAGGIAGLVALLVLGRMVFVALVSSFFPLTLLIMSVLGAIFFGIATPTEAAAVGSLGSLLLAAAYRSLSFDKVRESVYLTARTAAMVCWLFVGSFIFSSIFAYLGGHEPIKAFMNWMNPSPTMFLILTQIIIFVLGWPLEWTEIIVIFVPIFLPLLQQYGVDPLFFGILIALNIQTSFLSPPVAMAPFYLKGVAPPHVTINQIFSGVMPFLWLVLVAMVLVYVFPDIALWLPRYLYG
ncbi:MAG: TRAP transporter large permease subunit [Methylobacterium sp.]|nr:TRAP transporter large permease subunit [Methylobacterium sp.]